jgi:hypothetical protein
MSSVFSMGSMISVFSDDIRAALDEQKEQEEIARFQHHRECDAFITSHFGKTIDLADAKAIKAWLRTAVCTTLPGDGPNILAPLGLARQSALEWWEAIMPINPMLTLAPPTGVARKALRKISAAVSDAQEADARASGWTTRAPRVGRRSFTRL